MSLTISNHPERLITVGHGEYIVYHQEGGVKRAPSKATFHAALAVLNHFNTPSTEDRYAVILGKIKAIDPTLEVTFVPRTCYEMQFLKKCIREDLGRGDYCPNERVAPNPHAPTSTDCWHIVHFDCEESNNAEAVKAIAYNLNENLVKKLNKMSPDQTALPFESILALAGRQIQFFRNYHDTFNLVQRRSQGQFRSPIFSEGTPITKFSRGGLMGIGSDGDAGIVLNAVTLECHGIAAKAFLLYRGSDFPTDLPYSPQNNAQPYSYSFGSGLFAGALYRQGATAYTYAKESRDGYVLAVPAQEMISSELFVIPKKNAICHLASDNGVVFHPRTKVWETNETVWGFAQVRPRSFVEPWFSRLDRETLTDRVLNFKHDNVVFLKSSSRPVMAVPPAFQPAVRIHASVPSGASLYIRGSEGGLSWQKGQPLVQIGDDLWIYRVSNPFRHLDYKILIDDVVWEDGRNHTLEPVNDAAEAPCFEIPSAPSPGKATRLSVRYNAGAGDSLSIAGSGPGLSWGAPTPLRRVGDDLWVWETFRDFNNFEYKIVLNGSRWESGPNHRARLGLKEEVHPRV